MLETLKMINDSFKEEFVEQEYVKGDVIQLLQSLKELAENETKEKILKELGIKDFYVKIANITQKLEIFNETLQTEKITKNKCDFAVIGG